MKMRIAEVPTTLSKDGRSRPPHLKPWRDGWRHLKFMLLFSPRWLFLLPGLFVSVVSAVVYLALLGGERTVGGVGFDVHTLFFAGAGIVLGFLAMGFGLIIRMFGIREGLLQEHSLIDWLRASPALEVGGGVGLLVLLGGILFGADALLRWGEMGFGALEPGELLRQISVAITLGQLGGITLLVSLVIGFLALPTRAERQ